jgi:hypothetical protein
LDTSICGANFAPLAVEDDRSVREFSDTSTSKWWKSATVPNSSIGVGESPFPVQADFAKFSAATNTGVGGGEPLVHPEQSKDEEGGERRHQQDGVQTRENRIALHGKSPQKRGST